MTAESTNKWFGINCCISGINQRTPQYINIFEVVMELKLQIGISDNRIY